MTDVEQVVVAVPAHNELEHLPRCLRALMSAALCMPVPVLIVVVLDACDDGSERLAGQFGLDVHFVSVDAGNVGAARAAGFEYARGRCSAEEERTWYATTDADSAVSAQWLLRMTSVDADMVLGVVRVPAWRYLGSYQPKGRSHNNIHGANMGSRADAYSRVGGFRALPTGEDVERAGRLCAAPSRPQTQGWGPDVNADLVRQWHASGALEPPLPGGGAAAPGDDAVPCGRAYKVSATSAAFGRKRIAAQLFQRRHADRDWDAGPVLPPDVLRRLVSVGEVVFR